MTSETSPEAKWYPKVLPEIWAGMYDTSVYRRGSC